SVLVFMGGSPTSARAGLADLAPDGLLDVLDALALVGLGRAEAADFGSRLAQHFAVARHEDDEVLVDLRRDALGQLVRDGVRVAERERHLLAGDLGAVTDAVDLQLALEAAGHAGDHVLHQRAHEAVASALFALVAVARHLDLRSRELHFDPAGAAG